MHHSAAPSYSEGRALLLAPAPAQCMVLLWEEPACGWVQYGLTEPAVSKDTAQGGIPTDLHHAREQGTRSGLSPAHLCRSTRMLGRRLSFWAPNFARALTAAGEESRGTEEGLMPFTQRQSSPVHYCPKAVCLPHHQLLAKIFLPLLFLVLRSQAHLPDCPRSLWPS